jgi:hypothetical protein
MKNLKTVRDKATEFITTLIRLLDNPMDTLIVRNILARYSEAYEEDPEFTDDLTIRDLTTILPEVEVATWRPVLGCLRKRDQRVDHILRAAYDRWNADDEDDAGEYFLSQQNGIETLVVKVKAPARDRTNRKTTPVSTYC